MESACAACNTDHFDPPNTRIANAVPFMSNPIDRRDFRIFESVWLEIVFMKQA